MSSIEQAPCQNCGELISVEAKECPHCSDKKWTKNRYQAYVLLFIPLVAMVAGLVLYPMFNSANPDVTIWWLPGIIVATWGLGAYMAREQRQSYLEHLREAGRTDAQGEAE